MRQKQSISTATVFGNTVTLFKEKLSDDSICGSIEVKGNGKTWECLFYDLGKADEAYAKLTRTCINPMLDFYELT